MELRKLVSLLLLAALAIGSALSLTSCKKDEEEVTFIPTEYEGTTLYVYNWGEYISDGSEGSLDVVDRFEKTYGIEVKYDYYSTNEELYAQLNSDAKYDVIIPSDYMIAKLLEEDKLMKLDRSKLTNYGNVDPAYLGQYFDPTSEYAVPYAVGMIGVVYNTKLVDAEDVAGESWDLLWNPEYGDGQIINFNNPRDAFGVAMIEQGLSVNTTDPDEWERAYERLREQDCIYLMDEVFNKMENGSASVAAYYAGDCISMMGINPDLAFYYPTEGTNIFIDAMCIPKTAQNPGAAHLFIDFMLSEEIATANANYICYASPNTAVLTSPDYDFGEGKEGYSILYELPESYRTDSSKMQYYHNLDADTLALMNELWTRLGVEDTEEGGLELGTYVFLAIVVALIGWIGFYYGKKLYLSLKTRKHSIKAERQ